MVATYQQNEHSQFPVSWTQPSIEVGFIKNTPAMRSLSWSGILLLSLWHWLYKGRAPYYRHVFVCVDGNCVDLTTDGLDFYRKSDILPEVMQDTDWVTLDNRAEYVYDVNVLLLESMGVHISRADILRAFLNIPVKGEFCASFAAKILGLDVPKTVTPDELYSTLKQWQTE